MSRRRVEGLLLGLLVLVAGCNPHHPLEVKPSTPVPKKFATTSPQAKTFFPEHPWWLDFDNQELSHLIEEAFARNLDLKVGLARLLKARALLKEAVSYSYPAAQAGLTWQKSKEPGFFGENRGESYRLSLSASYEVDLWKRIRSSAKAATFSLKAFKEDLKAFYVGLAAEVAESYYLIATLHRQRALVEKLLHVSREELALARENYLQGLVAADEVLAAENQLFALEAQENDLEKRLSQAKHALALLLGRYPEEEITPEPLSLPPLDKAFPLGLPSEILRHRPDVQAAYWRVKAADAQVAALVAERFPRVNLLASLGRSHTAFSIGDIVGSFWSVGLEASLSLFEGGRTNARIRAQKAAALEALYTYQKTLLQAFREIEDAISANLSCERRLQDLEHQEKAMKDLLRLQLERYRLGLSNYLQVLKTKVELLKVAQARVEAQQELLAARISLYRALGGSWMGKYVAQALRGADES